MFHAPVEANNRVLADGERVAVRDAVRDVVTDGIAEAADARLGVVVDIFNQVLNVARDVIPPDVVVEVAGNRGTHLRALDDRERVHADDDRIGTSGRATERFHLCAAGAVLGNDRQQNALGVFAIRIEHGDETFRAIHGTQRVRVAHPQRAAGHVAHPEHALQGGVPTHF